MCRRREGRDSGIDIRHVNAEAEILLDLCEEGAEARMRRRRKRGDDAEDAAILRSHVLAAGGETEIDHVGDRAARRRGLIR